MTGPDPRALLRRLVSGDALTETEAEALVGGALDGALTAAQLAAALTAMAQRGETVAEIVGGARGLRARAVTIRAPADAIDVCGTGGDGLHTLNVSTAVSFVVAGCGVPVAKHGNRAASSRCGAADVLAALGVGIGCEPAVSERGLADDGICFLFAPRHHAAMRTVAPVRAELGFRNLFNHLGPLSNPAGVRRQLVGVAEARRVGELATALARLGTEAAWVVHGGDGMDELTLSGPSRVAILSGGAVRETSLDPAALGLTPAPTEALRGGDAAENAAALRRLLDDEPGAYRDAVRLNAAAALMVAGRVATLAEGLEAATASLASGAARAALARLVARTRVAEPAAAAAGA